MAAVTSLDELTDTWVLDYLTRRCHPSVAAAFRKDRGISDKTSSDCPNGLTTLENMASYVKSNSASHNFHSVSFLGGRVLHRKPLPRLPELVIQEVLSYLPTEDLFSTRLLSRDWNTMSSESLRRRYRVPVWLQSVDQICKLGETFANRPNTNWLNPFVIYHFFPEQDGTLDLLNLIGRDVKIGILEFTTNYPITSDKILNLLELTPDIEELCFYGHCDMVHVKGPVLRHLRTLGLSRGPSPPDARKRFQSFLYSTPGKHHLKLSVLQNWLQLAPALQELRFNYTIRPSTNKNFCLFAQLCHSLRLVSFTSIACPRDIGGHPTAILPNAELRLEIRSVPNQRGRGTTKLLEALAGSLNRLTVTLDSADVRFPQLPQLEHVRISGNPALWGGTLGLEASSFPCLRSVTLEFHDPGFDVRHPFADDVFPSVATLRLICHSDFLFLENDWQSVFPALMSLSVAGAICESAVSDIVEIFDHVTHLHLCDTGPRRSRDRSLVKGIFDTDYPTEWTFSSFKDLEHLELEVSWDLHRLILEVMKYSAEEVMPPLKNLTIYHGCAVAQRESDLFLLLRNLNYHEDVRLIFQEEPSYKAW